MLTKSCKAKGRFLQNWVRDKLLEIYLNAFPEGSVSKNDIKCAIMGEKGADVKFFSLAERLFPFQVECKNLKKYAGYKHYNQAKEHGDSMPIVVIKANNEDPLVILKATHFFDMFIK